MAVTYNNPMLFDCEKYKNKLSDYYNGNPIFLIFSVLMIIAFIISIISSFITEGESFRTLFHYDEFDVFMDHFNSVMYASDSPYTKWHVIYPPLIMVFYMVIGWMTLPYSYEIDSILTPAQESRNSMVPMMIFIMIVVILIVAYYLVSRFFTYKKLSELENIVFNSLILLSYPVIFGIERGNCIFICVLFVLLYLIGYNSDNKYVRILSYVCLGISAGIKIFPALFGILTLKKRGAIDFLYCVIIVSSLLIGPFIFVDGDIVMFVDTIINYSSTTVATNGCTNINDYLSIIGFPSVVNTIVNIIVVGVSLLLVLLNQNMKQWEEISIIAILMIITFSVTSPYLYLYMLLPLISFLTTEKEISNYNCTIVVCFTIVFMFVPALFYGPESVATIKSLFILISYFVIVGKSIKIMKKSYHTDDEITESFEKI